MEYTMEFYNFEFGEEILELLEYDLEGFDFTLTADDMETLRAELEDYGYETLEDLRELLECLEELQDEGEEDSLEIFLVKSLIKVMEVG